MFLNAQQPVGVEALRLAVGDARREIAIADHDAALPHPPLDRAAVLVPVRDVEQLHHVAGVIALAVQRAANFGADRGVVVGERQEVHGASGVAKTRRQPLGLRLLPALIEPLERR